MKIINSSVVALSLLVATASVCQAFQQRQPVSFVSRPTCQSSNGLGQLGSTAARTLKDDESSNRLLGEFRTASGEIINPYQVLSVDREAQRFEIRESYRTLSRKYHPDGHRHKTILPGNCNNLDDVRDQWERIKLAYEILSDSRTRRRYDRHEMLADPGAAMKRAAATAVGKGFKNIGKGIFDMGAFAVKAAVSTATATVTNGKEVKAKEPAQVEEPIPIELEPIEKLDE